MAHGSTIMNRYSSKPTIKLYKEVDLKMDKTTKDKVVAHTLEQNINKTYNIKLVIAKDTSKKRIAFCMLSRYCFLSSLFSFLTLFETSIQQ